MKKKENLWWGSCVEKTLLQINLCGIMFRYNVRMSGYGD